MPKNPVFMFQLTHEAGIEGASAIKKRKGEGNTCMNMYCNANQKKTICILENRGTM